MPSARPHQEAATEPAFDIVGMAASAGGLHALGVVLREIPEDFPAQIVVVQHLDPRHRSLMAELLNRRTALVVQEAKDGMKLEPGCVAIAPPNRHLLVGSDSTLSLSDSELVHFVRPSADLLFESIAGSHRERAIAVVLSGTGSDGSMGVRAVKQVHGTVIAQDPSTAEFTGMPVAAVETGSVDFVLRLEEIGPALVSLVMGGR